MVLNSERRSPLEIIASILGACRYSTKKGYVMYRCNMSSRQFDGYLDVMFKADLLVIENDCGSPLLRVSDKGRDFLRAYNNMKTLFE